MSETLIRASSFTVGFLFFLAHIKAISVFKFMSTISKTHITLTKYTFKTRLWNSLYIICMTRPGDSRWVSVFYVKCHSLLLSVSEENIMHQNGLYRLRVAFISLRMFFSDVYLSIECHFEHKFTN